jgi:hypothetical protein
VEVRLVVGSMGMSEATAEQKPRCCLPQTL